MNLINKQDVKAEHLLAEYDELGRRLGGEVPIKSEWIRARASFAWGLICGGNSVFKWDFHNLPDSSSPEYSKWLKNAVRCLRKFYWACFDVEQRDLLTKEKYDKLIKKRGKE